MHNRTIEYYAQTKEEQSTKKKGLLEYKPLLLHQNRETNAFKT